MIVQLYHENNFEKRYNSLKVPGTSVSYTEVSGEFKGNDPADIENPVIRIDYGVSTPHEFTYAYIPLFERYYFVDTWTWSEGYWSCVLREDMLATYRSGILDTTAFVLYSTSQYNADLADIRLSTEMIPTIASGSVSVVNSDYAVSAGGGIYALNVISSVGGQGTTTYFVDSGKVGSLIDTLCTEDVTELSEQIERLFAGAAINSIINCSYLPFNMPVTGNTIYIANYNTGVTGYNPPENMQLGGGTITIPWPYTDWRRSAPYLKMELFLPFYGKITLPVDEFLDADGVHIQLFLDTNTGGCTYFIETSGGGHTIEVINFNPAVNVPVSGMSVDAVGTLTSGASAIASAATLDIGSAISQAFGAVQAAMVPTTSTIGSYSGSRSSSFAMQLNDLYQTATLVLYYYEFSDNPSDLATSIGRPCYQNTVLSVLSGYCQCVNFSFSGGTVSEKEQINALMNGGVYIE